METGKLYFVKDSFYERFSNCGLLENKEMINGKPHKRHVVIYSNLIIVKMKYTGWFPSPQK